MKCFVSLLALTLAAPAVASPWQFDAPVDVIAARAGVHPHLSGAGRRHIAVRGNDVAVVWEDNRSGQPQVYVALRHNHRRPFSNPIRLSTGKTAYEPAIVSAGSENFVVAWEQDDAIHARIVAANGTIGPVAQLSTSGSQVTLAAFEGHVTAVWSEPQGRNRVLKLATLSVTAGEQLQIQHPVAVENNPPAGATPSFPSVVVTRAGIVVAWEDRRTVSTAIFYSHSPDGREFSAPRLVNERATPPPGAFGQGTTAMRVALAAQGDSGVVAVWLDKRTLGNGYDTYAAFSSNGGISFGANQMVQDKYANIFAQLNAVIVARTGPVVAIWNDDRDGNQDLWLSWPASGNRWNENLAVPGGSGPGDQTHPAVVMDNDGHLHLVWLDRAKADGPVRLRYLRARHTGP